MIINDTEIADFIGYAAANLAVETRADRVYVACYCMITGNDSVRKNWSVSAGTLSKSFEGTTLAEAIASYKKHCSPEAKRKQAEELKAQAAALEAEAGSTL